MHLLECGLFSKVCHVRGWTELRVSHLSYSLVVLKEKTSQCQVHFDVEHLHSFSGREHRSICVQGHI